MNMKREWNLDLLRVFCCIAVILEHSCGAYINDTKNIWGGGILCAVASASYFAVPCFLMLTGAFVNRRIGNVYDFYKKSFIKIGVPSLIFSVLYSLWYILLDVKRGNPSAGIFFVVKLWKTGWSGHPLWYMYMLVGVYALIPVVQKIIADTRGNVFVVYILLCVWAVISRYTSKFDTTWNLGHVVLYFSYIIVGYAIKSTFAGKNNKDGFFFIVCGFVFLIINGLLVYRCLLLDSNWRNWANNFSPLVMLGSILIFAGFCKVDCTKEIGIAKYTFIVYLLHKGVLEITEFVAGKFFIVKSNRSIAQVLIVIIVETFVVFIVSLCGAVAYQKLQFFFKKDR